MRELARPPRRPGSTRARRCCSSRRPAAAGRACGWSAAAGDLAEAIAAARREARAAFGDDTLLVERWISRPRHIEVQVFADAHGHVVHLGERECSLQRRHQKIVEEAPSPLLAGHPGGARIREAMGASAVAAARAVRLRGRRDGGVHRLRRPPGGVLLPGDEHPAAGGAPGHRAGRHLAGQEPLDLVEWQLRVAAGEPLPFRQEDVGFAGHAIEARVYAEDPARGFLPTGGRCCGWTSRPCPGSGSTPG